MEETAENINRKKILFISGNLRVTREICTLLADKFDFRTTDDLADGEQLLERHYSEISAILLDSMIAAEIGSEFIKRVSEEPKFMFIPIILVAAGIPLNEEINCLSLGAVDIIVSPFHKKLTELRIANAIRLKDSASFYEIERMLKALPSNIYLKDADCKYIFATHYWHHLDHANDKNWTIRGKTDVDIRKDKENAVEAMKADQEIMRTGKGTSYIIDINTDNIQEYFEVIKEPVWDENHKITGIVGLINNVTEHEKLRHKLKAAAETDGLTGLLNRRKIQAKIEKNLLESVNNHTPLSLIMLDIDNFKRVNDTYGHNEGDMVIKALAKVISNPDIIGTKDFYAGRWGGEEFMILLKNCDLSHAEAIAENIRKAFAFTDLRSLPHQTISLGVTQAKPWDSSDSICTRADMGLYNAKESGKNVVRSVY